ncbi:MAG: AAA domain-containing protein [Gammaproteobacteria bacterium]|nr:AAA domain-containing protein [Gammaproteobacteria bacterium]
MIWSTFSSLVLVDLIIVGLAVVLLAVSIPKGIFQKGRVPLTGRVLIAAGIVTTALYYLADLVVLTVLPELVEPAASHAAMEFLQQHLRVPVTLLSFALIVAGGIASARYFAESEQSMRRSEKNAAKAVERIVDSENRFRSLVEQYTDSVYCFEFSPPIDTTLPLDEQACQTYDGVLVECNSAYARAVGASSPAQIIGKRYRHMNSAFGAEAHEQLFRDFVAGGYRLVDREDHSTSTEGIERALLLNITGVIKNGGLFRVWGSEKDILATRKAESGLRDRARFQQTVADISSRLITTPDEHLGEVLQGSLKLACRYAMADRVSLIWFDRTTNRAELLFSWNEHGGPPWVELSIDAFSWSAAQLLRGETVAIDVVANMPDVVKDKLLMTRLGVKSIAVVPVVIGGDVVGVCGFASIHEEIQWSEQLLKDIELLSSLLSNVVNRMNVKKSLDDALDELRLARDRLQAENVYLRQEIRSTHGFNELVGESKVLIKCLQQVAQVAETDTTVLVLGETGTGKELVARAVHERSNRSDRALVKVNCAALPANLIESELFGHEKGAFTGADSRKRGRFDLADGGTMFLDEIGDLPIDLQGKLLRVLQEGEFERLGGSRTIQVDVRIIAATNRMLQEAVDHGDFRADLFYRINTFPIMLPPLRERKEDIPILVEHFIAKHAPALGREVTGVSGIMMEQLDAFSWPGNVRELESIVQRALISAGGPVLGLAEALDKKRLVSPAPVSTIIGTVESPLDLRSAEREHISTILAQTEWQIAGPGGAAAKLGIPPSTLRSKMKKLGIQRNTEH